MYWVGAPFATRSSMDSYSFGIIVMLIVSTIAKYAKAKFMLMFDGHYIWVYVGCMVKNMAIISIIMPHKRTLM